MDHHQEEHDTNSLRARRKKSAVGITCCFSGGTTVKRHLRRSSFDAASSNSSHPSPLRSPSAWIKSKANELPEIKGKCRNFISRMGRHRRHSSAEFSYDPLSYALNFDDDQLSPHDDSAGPTANFTARLPVSPPLTPKSGSDDLRRGFEALSIMSTTMKRSSGASTTSNYHHHAVKVPAAGVHQRRSNKARRDQLSSSPRVAAVAEVRRTLEAPDEVTSPVGINSSNVKVLVQLG